MFNNYSISKIFYTTEKKPRLFWAMLLLFFDNRVKPSYHFHKGKFLLITAISFEVLRTAFSQFRNNNILQNAYATGFIAVVLLFLLIIVTKYILRIDFKNIGLKALKLWNLYEKTYLLIIAPSGIFIFYFLTQSQFHNALFEKGWTGLFISFIIFQSWGFYQEWIYRGFIQTELTRRFHAIIAIFISNLLFTLGPLHFQQFFIGDYTLIAATFMIGLIFGIIYHRSYNLFIPGFLHGIGTWFLVGLYL